MGVSKYKAFISYSHQDKTWANWLHKRLETYPVPRRIIGSETPKGIVPRRLTPIFRDREELEAAGSLSDKIQAALVSSENMVVLCSPRAAKSHWVNQEILQYKRLHPDGDIFSVIADGEPFASNMPGREDEECFPPALRFEIGNNGELSDKPAEPLAADLRPQGDGKRGGSLKLIAGLIGVGLDELIQRDLQRARKRVMAVTGTSLAGMLIMATLTGFALTARKEADARRNDAEGLIEFMLTDLREKLEPVGRLDVLESVGQEAVSYYDGQDINKMKDDALGRRARVFHYLGEIDNEQGNMDIAIARWQRSYETTKALLERNPGNSQRIFDHAQSAFWVGYGYQETRNYNLTEKYYIEYRELTDDLVKIEPNNLDWQLERTWGLSNLILVYLAKSEHYKAIDAAERAVEGFQGILKKRPNDRETQIALATDGYNYLIRSHEMVSPISKALELRKLQVRLYQEMLEKDPGDAKVRTYLISAQFNISGHLFHIGKVEKAKELLRLQIEDSLRLIRIDDSNVNLKQALIIYTIELANFYKETGQLEEAEIQLEKISALVSELMKSAAFPLEFKFTYKIPYDIASAEINYRNGNYAGALKYLNDVLDASPHEVELDYHAITSNYIKALLLQGKIKSAQGDEMEAIEIWSEILSFDRSTKSLSLPANRLLFYETYKRLDMEIDAKKERDKLYDLGVSEKHLRIDNIKGENYE